MKNTTADTHPEFTEFVELYGSTKKTISFLKDWQGPNHTLGNAVNHVDRRLMLANGDFARSVDGKGRRVVFIGTVYGLVVLYERHETRNDKRVSFNTTKKLVEKEFVTQAFIEDLGYIPFQIITSENFRDVARRAADIDNDAGDGLVVFEHVPVVKKKKYPPRRPNKTPAPQQVATDTEGAGDHSFMLPA